MADSLNLGVIAEGVETQEQLDYLLKHGIEIVQGYYYSKPEPLEYYYSNVTQENRKLKIVRD